MLPSHHSTTFSTQADQQQMRDFSLLESGIEDKRALRRGMASMTDYFSQLYYWGR